MEFVDGSYEWWAALSRPVAAFGTDASRAEQKPAAAAAGWIIIASFLLETQDAA
jgi:hypothetical protein